MSIPCKPFYFIRHGETEWNRQGIYMGYKDIPLNETGRAQAHNAKKHFKKELITHIVTSSLIRAYETAQIINEELCLPLTILDELRERRLGKVEGEYKKDEKTFEKWLKEDSPEGAESRLNFERRVVLGFQKSIELDHNVLIVSHGGVYTMLCHFMGWPFNDLKNCDAIFHNPPSEKSPFWSLRELS